MSRLLCFGFGYCAEALAHRLAGHGWSVAGTSTTSTGAARIMGMGMAGLRFDGTGVSDDLRTEIGGATHVLVSVPPDVDGDPVLRTCGSLLAAAPHLQWVAYLSTIGVYGDTGGAWVDENTPPRPRQERSIRRVDAENAWLAFGKDAGANVQIFRLAGIYGPGRNQFRGLLDGSARRIVKPGQVFNRIHLADIVQTLEAGIARGASGRIYNVTDDEPAPPDEVIVFAAGLLGVPPPPATPFETAELSPMAASFYADNRRVRNDRLRRELDVRLRHPTYREGLQALAAELNAGRTRSDQKVKST